MHWSCPFVFPFCMAITKLDKKQKQAKSSIIVATCKRQRQHQPHRQQLPTDCCRCGNMAQFWLLNIIIISHLRTIFAYCSKDRPPTTTTATIVAAAAATTTKPTMATTAEKRWPLLIIFWSDKRNEKKIDRWLQAEENVWNSLRNFNTLPSFKVLSFKSSRKQVNSFQFISNYVMLESI